MAKKKDCYHYNSKHSRATFISKLQDYIQNFLGDPSCIHRYSTTYITRKNQPLRVAPLLENPSLLLYVLCYMPFSQLLKLSSDPNCKSCRKHARDKEVSHEKYAPGNETSMMNTASLTAREEKYGDVPRSGNPWSASVSTRGRCCFSG